MKFDLAFPASATIPVPQDSGYALFAAISRVVPTIHESAGIGLHPLRGRQLGDRRIQLVESSYVTLRIDDAHISQMLQLSGASLSLGTSEIRLGVPRLHSLICSPVVRSRLVTIKGMMTQESFVEAVQRQLLGQDVASTANIVLGKRRTIRIRSREIVGFEVLIERLSAAESIAIQEHGIGGRRHMGCGVFAAFQG